MMNFEVYLGSAWLGTIQARDEADAAGVALRTFGSHLVGILKIKRADSRTRPSESTPAQAPSLR